MRWLSSRRNITLMMLPALLIYGVYFAFPVGYSLYESFTDAAAGVGKQHFVGTANYRAMVHDHVALTSLRNTGIVMVVALVLLLPGAFLLALLMNRGTRGSGTMRAVVFAPAVVAPILIGLIWVFILDPQLGLLNVTLRALGWKEPPQWIGGVHLTPYSVGVVYVWQTIGFIMTIFYAGLRMLPRDVMEASALDGASRWQQLRYVTLPMLSETTSICTVLVITGVFKVFELVFQLTGGGPVHLSEVVVSYTYFVTFSNQQYGYGMALATVVFLLGALTALGYLTVSRRRRAAA